MATHEERRLSVENESFRGEKRFSDLASVLDIEVVSALAIENGPFGVAELADRDVSYVMLRDVGVSPLDADRLRRRYSLVWTFVWTEGAHLLQRAEQLRTLRETERAWIAASTTTARRHRHRARRQWRKIRRAGGEPRPRDAEADDASDPRSKAGACPRCGDDLRRYTLGRCETVTCDGCGFARLEAAHDVAARPGAAKSAGEREETGTDLSWEESVRQFVGG